MSRADQAQGRRMQKFRDVLSSWEAGCLSQLEAAALLGCSERTFRRYRDKYHDAGEDGLVDHRLEKPSARAIAAETRAEMLALYRARHRGWTAKHFHDHGVRHHGFSWGYTWTKCQLQAAGLVERSTLKGAHRRKRERKPCEGMMLHQDGSRHVWFAGQPALDLIVTMDDATSVIYSAFFVEEEGTASTFRGLMEVMSAYGLPSQLYTDRGSHYFYTPEAGGKVDKARLTQVGRALFRLGVEHIAAYSPEARGRSERLFGTLQDRLVKELALHGIRDVATANAWIKDTFLQAHNRLFATQPAVSDSAFVAVDHAVLTETLCTEEERVVARDNTISFEGDRLQIPESAVRAHYVKATVKVREYPDGRRAIFHGPRCIARFTAEGTAAPLAAVAMGKSQVSGSGGATVAACSTASRRGLEMPVPVSPPEHRPSLTRPARAATGLPSPKASGCAA
jgi:transposase